MDREQVLRRALWATAVFNLGGAVMLGFPASPPAQLAGMPADVPLLYRALTAMFVLLFGGAYAWLAAQPAIDRPFVRFGAIGKSCAFATVLLLWLAGVAAGRSVAVFSGDLAFAALFFWCLAGLQPPGPGNRT
jgi:hypothetical protein